MPVMTVVAIAMLILSCGDGTVEPAPPPAPPPAPVATTVTVSPGSATLTALGGTARFTAEVRDQNGQVMAGVGVAWSSSDTLVARVDNAGLATGVAEGAATITAAVGEVSGTAEITTVENPDRAALVALYAATDGPNWVDNTNWLTDAPLGEWYGIDTDAAGRVVRIDLSGRYNEATFRTDRHGLSGQIPPELGNLTELEEMNLGSNFLTGTIPPELGNLASLKSLRLTENGLVGVIPPELGDLAILRTLLLYRNSLAGPIPPELAELANLNWLDLRWNDLTGPIPPELRGLKRLEVLELGWNNLTGAIPPWLTDLTELRELNLRDNDLTGPILPELGDLANLRMLLLDQNNLSGTIPRELANLHDLRWLLAYQNNLTGRIPRELGNLTNLNQLSLSDNSLSGPIPWELGNLTNLRGLTLSENNLTGRIPTELGNLRELRDIDLSENQLTGSVPVSFAGLDKLASFGCRGTIGACLPATDEFREWVKQVDARGNVALPVDVPFCDEIDRTALEALYEAAGGSGWARSDGWLDDEDLGRWHGVRTDPAGRVAGLDLTGNGLSGYVPDALRLLAGLTELRIGDNALAGRLPVSLASVPLKVFDYGGTSLCVADDPVFREWVRGIPRYVGTGVQCPPLTDREILEHLYRNTGGRNWNQSAGWLTEAPLTQWQGVETDAAGRVVALRLGRNGLSGSLPVELGQLSEVRVMDLHANKLSGSIPAELGDLANLTGLHLNWNEFTGAIPAQVGQLSNLEVLGLDGNELSGTIPPVLADLANLTWLGLGWNELTGSIPPELGRLTNLNGLRLGGNILSGPVPPEVGDLSSLGRLEIQDNQLTGVIPPELGKLTAIRTIRLAHNRLTGVIPQELGALKRLSALDLSGNLLTGPMPAELGGLTNLRELRLSGNDMSGSIPAVLGDLANLTVLELTGNLLSGSIPGELGRLANLDGLHLGNNQLSGPLPAELGHARGVESLDLRSNALDGPVPPEFGNLTLLRSLILADNADLAGPLPSEFLAVGGIERFMAGGTGLCWPPDARFSAWFRAIADRRMRRCLGGSDVYLTQAVQSWDDPVPLLAGQSALLRVFVTAPHETTATVPPVRATFYVNGVQRHSIDIAEGAKPIPMEITEGDLALSANAEIPDWVIAPGLEMVIEVDPEGTLDPALGVRRRVPDSGRMAVDVRTVAPFDLTLIPFLLESNPDLSAVEDVSAMAANPDGHELLGDVRTLLPVAEIAAVAHEPVFVSTPYIYSMLNQVQAIRLMEGGSGYWMGIWDGRLNPGGRFASTAVAIRGGHASISTRHAPTIAHELGHNLSLGHAPCGSPTGIDPWFPHAAGRSGAWGYDFERDALVTPDTPDIMSYCWQGRVWISDYFFNKALDHRFSSAAAAAARRTRTLLLWGGRDEDGVPFLDPGFVVDAMSALPPPGTEYSIEGMDADGVPVFSYTFDMPVPADSEGEEAGFVFALPVEAGWADGLASITLSGPGGSAVLDETTNRPMAILRDPRTGQVRAFLSDLPPATQTAADAVGRGAGTEGLETLFSRGIPTADAWKR